MTRVKNMKWKRINRERKKIKRKMKRKLNRDRENYKQKGEKEEVGK